MTKTVGICTELKEEGGTASPAESKERRVFIAGRGGGGGGGGGARVLVQDKFNPEPSLFGIEIDHRLQPTTALPDGPTNNLVQLLRPLYLNPVPSTRKLYQLSLWHIRLDKPAPPRIHEVILIACHNDHLRNQSRDLSQPVPADSMCQSSSHLRDNADEWLRSGGVIPPQQVLELRLARKSPTEGETRNLPPFLSLYSSDRGGLLLLWLPTTPLGTAFQEISMPAHLDL